MKVRYAILCAAWIMSISILFVFSYAHSGKTDGTGGHFNKSTGEYHYHHGYSAHDHWDMDDDGDIDCPYTFKDNTKYNNEESYSNYSTSIYSYNDTDSVSQKEVKSEVSSFVYWVITILVIVVIIMYSIISSKNKAIDFKERYYKNKQADDEIVVREGIKSLNDALETTYGKNYLYILSGAPEGDYIGDDLLPHSSSASKGIFLDQYTFYLGGPPSGSDVKYHHASCRYARSEYPINAINLQKYRRFYPCMVCRCGLPDTSWVEKYRKHKDFLSKYIDFEKDDTKMSFKHDPSIKINFRGSP